MAYNQVKKQIFENFISCTLWPTEFTKIYILDFYEKRLDIPGIDYVVVIFHIFFSVSQNNVESDRL